MLSFVKGLFPAKLCPVILREAGLREETLAGTLKEEEWNALVMAVSHFLLRINGYMGYEKAQVTRRMLTAPVEAIIFNGHFRVVQ